MGGLDLYFVKHGGVFWHEIEKTACHWFVSAFAIAFLVILSSPCMAASSGPGKCGSFAYRNKPIHPALVHEFEPFISDHVAPVTVRLNVTAAYGSNEYFYPVEKLAGDRIGYENNGETFSYHVIGCAAGRYILRTYDNAGGSGIFESVLVVNLSSGTTFGPDGTHVTPATFLTVSRRIPLGDRDAASVRLDGNTLVIGKSSYRHSSLRIDLSVSQKP